MDPEASHLVSRGKLQWSTERERFSEAGQRSNKQKTQFQIRSSLFGYKMVSLGGFRHLHSMEIERALIGVDQEISH